MSRIAYFLVASLFIPSIARATTDCSAFAPHASRDTAAAFATVETACTRPVYLVSKFIDSTYKAVFTRVGGDSGYAVAHVASSLWGGDGRHEYSKRQAWSADKTLLYIQNEPCNTCDAIAQCPGGPSDNGDNGQSASPSKVFLNGTTYLPLNVGQDSTIRSLKEPLWHPDSADVMIGFVDSGTVSVLKWMNVRTGAQRRSWTLPIKIKGIGPDEGNPSNNGRYIALLSSNAHDAIVVDMATFGGGGNTKISAPYAVNSCGLCTNCAIDYVTVSSGGTYLIVAYEDNFIRIYDINWSIPQITGPHVVTDCGCYSATTALDGDQGYITPLSHADYLTYESNEYAIGFEFCYTSGACPDTGSFDFTNDVLDDGRLVLVKLSDGSLRHISEGTAAHSLNDEAWGEHASARNTGMPGWVFASYAKETVSPPTPLPRFAGEIVAWSLGTNKEVRRLGVPHSVWSPSDQSYDCYRAQFHPSPSPDGKRVIFASNWRQYVNGSETSYAPNTWRKAYVLDTRPFPEVINDLSEGFPKSSGSIRLKWTARHNDIADTTHDQTAVQAYEVRVSTSEITPTNFYDATYVTPPSTPKSRGGVEALMWVV